MGFIKLSNEPLGFIKLTKLGSLNMDLYKNNTVTPTEQYMLLREVQVMCPEQYGTVPVSRFSKKC